MSEPMNIYVPKFVPKNLPWYERDSLMTWYDQIKGEEFFRDTDQHFQQGKILNFDIIHRKCCGEEVPKDLLKHYQTVNDKSVSDSPTSEKDQILSSAFRTDREDIFFEKETVKKHFNKKIKSKTILLHTNSF